ncbi:MAG: efflux RND transporter periplasmic adaptor subunit [Planctomycetales bacterium]|nr:efflux RND transporter periplasmic adaptor subunit [Planctomycetales bacterium]
MVLPLVILGVGIGCYSYLSQPLEKSKDPPAEEEKIRTNVKQLAMQDYQVVVNTNGIVLAHNEVELSAQVAGQVKTIHPSFELGASFTAGDVLVELESSDYETALAIASAQVDGAKSALELAKLVHERNKALFEKSSISEAEVNQADATRKQAAAQLDSAEAQLRQAQRDLDRTKIIAPFDGRVRLKQIGIGQLVSAGTPIGTVFAIDYAEVRLPLSSREMKFLTLPESIEDSPIDVTFRDAIDKNSDSVWHGKILRTEGTLDQDSLELFAIARIVDPFGHESGQPPLRPGQPVAASVPGMVIRNAIALPRSAVRQLDQIFLVDKTALTLSERTIVPIWSDEDSVIVQDPDTVHDGALLATTTLVYPPEGAKVEIIPDIPPTTAEAKTTSPKGSAAN